MATKQFLNFYENIKEAKLRLENTVVLYDNEPYYVLTITDDKPDGIFRAYLDPIGSPSGPITNSYNDCPYDYPPIPDKSKLMDAWMAKYPESGLVRKMLNSPAFNRFRPFPLGMVNRDGKTVYLERQPQRHTQQGLTQQMILQTPVCLEPDKARIPGVPLHSPCMREAICGDYPTIKDCFDNLANPEVVNDAVAFHRYFALIRGPIDTLFLNYRGDTIGFLPNGDSTVLRLAKPFTHCKEVVEGLGVFDKIITR